MLFYCSKVQHRHNENLWSDRIPNQFNAVHVPTSYRSKFLYYSPIHVPDSHLSPEGKGCTWGSAADVLNTFSRHIQTTLSQGKALLARAQAGAVWTREPAWTLRRIEKSLSWCISNPESSSPKGLIKATPGCQILSGYLKANLPQY